MLFLPWRRDERECYRDLDQSSLARLFRKQNNENSSRSASVPMVDRLSPVNLLRQLPSPISGLVQQQRIVLAENRPMPRDWDQVARSAFRSRTRLAPSQRSVQADQTLLRRSKRLIRDRPLPRSIQHRISTKRACDVSMAREALLL